MRPAVHELSGQVVLPSGVQPGRLRFGARITALDFSPSAGSDYVLPGFIDTHVHGGGGGDTMDGAAGIAALCRLHARCGTTSLLATTITNPWPQVLAALHATAQLRQRGVPGGADILGAHLEGPFISPQRLGAQPPFALEPTPQYVKEVLALDVVKAVTLAPELPGALMAARGFAQAGVRVGIGHTRADAATVQDALRVVREAGGESCATHLFNAMGGIEGRAPGPAGALLADKHAYAEVILDGFHVDPTSFLLARAAAPQRLMLITDAMRAAGLGDGPSELGGQAVSVTGGRATLPDGTLAGSVLTLDAALRNAVQAGVPLPEVSQMLSGVPAASLRLSDRGHLRPGLRADVVVLSPELHIKAVYVGGQLIPLKEDEDS